MSIKCVLVIVAAIASAWFAPVVKAAPWSVCGIPRISTVAVSGVETIDDPFDLNKFKFTFKAINFTDQNVGSFSALRDNR